MGTDVLGILLAISFTTSAVLMLVVARLIRKG
jgi:hypothetical protein